MENNSRIWECLCKAGKGQSGTSTLPLELPTSEQIWRSPLGEANPFFPNRGFQTGRLAASSRPKEACFSRILWSPVPSLWEKRILKIFSQGLFPWSWGRDQRPNRTGEGKPHGQVFALQETSKWNLLCQERSWLLWRHPCVWSCVPNKGAHRAWFSLCSFEAVVQTTAWESIECSPLPLRDFSLL